MRVLDKYIVRQYITSYLIILISFSVLFIVIEVFDRLPRVLRHTSDFWLIAQYFLLRVPYLFVLTSPVNVLLAGLFLMNSLSKYNESIAIRAAGISIFRMITPLLIIGIFISAIVALFGEYVMPKANTRQNYIYNVEMRQREVEDIRIRSNIYYSDDRFIYFIGFFDGFQNRKRIIDITQLDSDNRIIRKIQANEAIWNGEDWEFVNTHIRDFDDSELINYAFFQNIVLPYISVTPLDFIKSGKSPMQMNYMELSEYIERLQRIGDKHHRELIDLYMKISFPLANFIILLFCVPMATASMRSKGRGILFLLGLFICFLYLLVLRIFQSLGYNEIIYPLTAVLMPHIIFFSLGVFFVIKAEI
ncbi:MAG: LptF/LptG family permease [Candidatus Cloacimonetes bacterium]|nr:LptF/LptG family permease [Candidatus Cloacimonadota bacterium]